VNCREIVYLEDDHDPEVLVWLKRYRYWLLVPVFLLAAVTAWRYASTLRLLITDPSTLEAWTLRLGWFGPAALIGLNALQIVLAPIPGYVVQVAAGFLYGPLWGGIWGSIGLVLGATLAFWIARIFGRPLAEKLVGAGQLTKWESTTHSTSTIVWFFLLLGPTGDVPYFLAGLASVGYLKILLITIVLRVPAVFLAAAAGGRAIPWWQLALIYGVLAAIAGIFLIYQDRLQIWMERGAVGDNDDPESSQSDPSETEPTHMDQLSIELNRDNS
jgi:uncharacterized membrane protein YdjX (TVP38/TMEM64 family)